MDIISSIDMLKAMLNRDALIIKIKQPFLDWLHQLPDDLTSDEITLEDLNKEPTIYLIPSGIYYEHKEDILKNIYPMIFEEALCGWWNRTSDWPKKRKLNMFKQWFDVEYTSVIINTVDGLILDEDD